MTTYLYWLIWPGVSLDDVLDTIFELKKGCASDPMMHNSCINYANMLIYIEIIPNITGRKNIRPCFLIEENKPGQRSSIFKKIVVFSFNISRWK